MNCEQEVNNVCTWIKEYVENAGCVGVVLGVSGGVDSAVVAALCVRALGSENVLAVMMPENENGRMVIDELNLDEAVSYSKFLSISEDVCLHFLPEDRINDIVKGNIASRLRMVCLYAWANALNYLVVGTTNKSEYEVNYFTKYGDGGVDCEPIADYYKTEVYEMARYLGIPKEVIDAEPSAGLWDGQTDEDELGMDYIQLDRILRDPYNFSLEGKKRVVELITCGDHKKHVPPSYKRK